MFPKISFVGLILLSLPAFCNAQSLSVQIKKAPIRQAPSFLSKIVSNATHKNDVAILEKQGAWRLVELPPHRGWMHISALIKPNLTLYAGAAINQDISSREISLAGKGFNSDIENSYKEANAHLSYVWVDKMEQTSISLRELEKFARASDFKTTPR